MSSNGIWKMCVCNKKKKKVNKKGRKKKFKNKNKNKSFKTIAIKGSFYFSSILPQSAFCKERHEKQGRRVKHAYIHTYIYTVATTTNFKG